MQMPLFRVHQRLQFFNRSLCIVQLVWLTSTGNCYSSLGPIARLVSHPQPFQLTFAPPQVASSTGPVYQAQQAPFQAIQTASSKHPTLVLSVGPTSASTAQASCWDIAPPLDGDQGYVTSVIDLYLDQGADLEALCDSPTVREPVTYDVRMLPLALKLTQHYWETVHAV